MKRYFGGLMLLVAIVATFQAKGDLEAATSIGIIWLLLGVPGAILLFRKSKSKD
jgi:hypothetical protein